MHSIFEVTHRSGRQETIKAKGVAQAKKIKTDLDKAREIVSVLLYKQMSEGEHKKRVQFFVDSDAYNTKLQQATEAGKSVSDLAKESFA